MLNGATLIVLIKQQIVNNDCAKVIVWPQSKFSYEIECTVVIINKINIVFYYTKRNNNNIL